MNAVSLAQLLLVLLTPSTGQSDYGYGGHPNCTPGYDKDCSTPMTFTGAALSQSVSPPKVEHHQDGTSLHHRFHSSTKPQPQHHKGSTVKETSPSGAAEKEKCQLDIPNECIFPFRYKGQQYSACTDVDAVGTKWCSTQRDYEGSWRECKSTCNEKWPVKSIVGTAVAGGVAAAGLGMAVAATELSRHQWHKLGSEASIQQVKPETLSNGGSASAEATHGSNLGSTTVSVPAASARFLDKQSSGTAQMLTGNAAEQFVTTAALLPSWMWVVGVVTMAVCCGVSISGIVAMCLAKQQKRGDYVEIDEEEESDTYVE